MDHRICNNNKKRLAINLHGVTAKSKIKTIIKPGWAWIESVIYFGRNEQQKYRKKL